MQTRNHAQPPNVADATLHCPYVVRLRRSLSARAECAVRFGTSWLMVTFRSVSALCAIDYARQRANEELISLLGSNTA